MQLTRWLAGLFLGLSTVAIAQESDSLRPRSLFAEAGGYAISGQHTPFWLRANQYGIVPTNGSVGTLRLGAYADYRVPQRDSAGNAIKLRRFDWGYGLNVVGNAGNSSQLILAEGYVKVRFHQIELYAGRRREIVGLTDTLLTSGSYSWSGNALPMPKIQIGTIGYAPIKFTKGLIAINAFFSHGWFNDGFVQNSYLHQKAFYGRLGKPNWRVKLYAGFSDQAQWSGYSPGLASTGDPGFSNNGYLASGLDSYFRVVTTLRGSSPYSTNPNIVSVDQGNRIGNHLGSFDGAIEVRIGSYQVTAYRQNLYETGALFYLTNIADGLNGIRFKRLTRGQSNFTVDRLALEFFYSKSQGGPEFVIDDPQRRGRNNYFNHSQYRDGWSYLGRTLGTPFLSQRSEVRTELMNESISNNRVSLFHLAMAGTVYQRLQWLMKLSYSQNFGTYGSPYPAGTNQFSGLLQVATPLQLPALGECQLNASLALDQGKLLYNSTGLYVGLRKALASRTATRQATAGSRFWPLSTPQ